MIGLGLASAFLACLCYGVASVAQAIGVRDAASAGGTSLAAALSRQPLYVAGLGLDALGFLVSLLALHTLPLFVTEAVLAASVGVTALAAARWLHTRLRRGERAALTVLGVGLVFLAVCADGGDVPPLPTAAIVGLLAVAAALAVATAAIARGAGRRVVADTTPATGSARTRGAAAAAGLAFAGVGITTRVMPVPADWWTLVAHPGLYALALFGITGTVAFAYALQHGAVTSVAAIVFGIETVVPALVGVLALGDRPRPGLLPVAVVGFVLTVAATLALSRYAEPAPTEPAPPRLDQLAAGAD